jgi:hypothetical protein
VLPRALERRLGAPAYNLAVAAGQAPSTFFLLRRALEAGARPSAVIVDYNMFLLANSPWATIDRLPKLLSFRDALDLAWTARDARLFGVLTVSRNVPAYRSRTTLRLAVLLALQGQALRQGKEFLAYRRNQTSNRGALVAPRRTEPLGPPDLNEPSTVPRDWRPDPVNARFVRRFLALTRERGIAVYWILPPPMPGVQAARERVGSDAAYLRFMARTTAKAPHVTVVDGRRAVYPAEVYSDPLHFDCRGMLAFSDDLAALLQQHPPGQPDRPRWLRLPDYAERSEAVALEDFDESRRIIDGLAKRLRR